jgi:hypothetical protein
MASQPGIYLFCKCELRNTDYVSVSLGSGLPYFLSLLLAFDKIAYDSPGLLLLFFSCAIPI